MAEGAVLGIIEIYDKIIEEKRPTPARFHYLFNLRDISKVIQGMLMIKPVSCSSPESFAKLWMHEICRVFHDRLINQDDRDWFTHQICDLANVFLRVRMEHDELFVKGKMFFGDILKLDSTKNYEEIKDHNKLKNTLNDFLEDYNMSSSA